MLMQEKYDLMFNWWKRSDNKLRPILRSGKDGGVYSRLSFLDHLHIVELNGLKDDLQRCIEYSRNIDQGFDSGGVEHMDITYSYPNIVIDDVITLPMQDMITLIDEWIAFLENKPR